VLSQWPFIIAAANDRFPPSTSMARNTPHLE
jgi:hypothetical protein